MSIPLEDLFNVIAKSMRGLGLNETVLEKKRDEIALLLDEA